MIHRISPRRLLGHENGSPEQKEAREPRAPAEARPGSTRRYTNSLEPMSMCVLNSTVKSRVSLRCDKSVTQPGEEVKLQWSSSPELDNEFDLSKWDFLE